MPSTSVEILQTASFRLCYMTVGKSPPSDVELSKKEDWRSNFPWFLNRNVFL